MSNTQNPPTRMLPIKPVCERYGISAQTVDRWLERGLLPEPMRVRRYRYGSESNLDDFDKKRRDAQRERAGVTKEKSSKKDHAEKKKTAAPFAGAAIPKHLGYADLNNRI